MLRAGRSGGFVVQLVREAQSQRADRGVAPREVAVQGHRGMDISDVPVPAQHVRVALVPILVNLLEIGRPARPQA